jgi:type II secretory pathway predicted ATPase ExeA
VVLEYYGLTEQPFGASPDPRYLYPTVTHREALASLSYGVTSVQGFMSLIAKPGMGKTTLLFSLLQDISPSIRTVFLFQTCQTAQDLLSSLLIDLGVQDGGSNLAHMQARLNEILVRETENGRRIVVVVDEAQNLSNDMLELLRMLSNFETPAEKLIQIILAGQPNLADKLASPELTQLRQRISISARLSPFSPEETHLYIAHRLGVAGYTAQQPLFTRDAEVLIHQHSEGIPRNINRICFNALSLGCAMKEKTIGRASIEEVLSDLDFASFGKSVPVRKPPVAVAQEVPELFTHLRADSPRKSKFGRSAMLKVAMVAILVSFAAWKVAPLAEITHASAPPPVTAIATRATQELPKVESAPTMQASPDLPPASDSTKVSEGLPQTPEAAKPTETNKDLFQLVSKSTPVNPAETAAQVAIAPEPAPRNFSRLGSRSRPVNEAKLTQPATQAMIAATAPDSNAKVAPLVPPAAQVAPAEDPASLWKRVGAADTNAAVTLAKMYIDGGSLGKDCEQAQVLLLAASKAGNKNADLLLSDSFAKSCR